MRLVFLGLAVVAAMLLGSATAQAGLITGGASFVGTPQHHNHLGEFRDHNSNAYWRGICLVQCYFRDLHVDRIAFGHPC